LRKYVKSAGQMRQVSPALVRVITQIGLKSSNCERRQ
jgi:hypothetical protein